jgi:hypothetical protein
MHVIGHQHIGVNRTAKLLCQLGRVPVVFLGVKACGAVAAALNDVPGVPARVECNYDRPRTLIRRGDPLQRYRHAAVKLLEALEADPNVEVIPLSEQLYARAFRLYRE